MSEKIKEKMNSRRHQSYRFRYYRNIHENYCKTKCNNQIFDSLKFTVFFFFFGGIQIHAFQQFNNRDYQKLIFYRIILFSNSCQFFKLSNNTVPDNISYKFNLHKSSQ